MYSIENVLLKIEIFPLILASLFIILSCLKRPHTTGIYRHIPNIKSQTYTGSVRFPTSREARSALTGLPGVRSMECLSKVCSTVPPLPKSLRHKQTQIFKDKMLKVQVRSPLPPHTHTHTHTLSSLPHTHTHTHSYSFLSHTLSPCRVCLTHTHIRLPLSLISTNDTL